METGEEWRKQPDNWCVGELKAFFCLFVLLLSLQVEALPRELMRKEALMLVPRMLPTLGELFFYLLKSLELDWF